MIESTFLSRNRKDDALLDVRPDRAEGRNARDRIGVEIERQSAIERGLADQERAARVAVTRRQLAQADQRVGIAVFTHVGKDRNRDLALVEVEQQLHRADDL